MGVTVTWRRVVAWAARDAEDSRRECAELAKLSALPLLAGWPLMGLIAMAWGGLWDSITLRATIGAGYALFGAAAWRGRFSHPVRWAWIAFNAFALVLYPWQMYMASGHSLFWQNSLLFFSLALGVTLRSRDSLAGLALGLAMVAAAGTPPGAVERGQSGLWAVIQAMAVVAFLSTRAQRRRLERLLAEREASQAALRESEAKLRAVVENAADTLFTYTPDGRVTFVSNAVRAFGFEPAEVVGRAFIDFVHPDDREMVRREHSDTVQKAHEKTVGFRVRRRDGAVRQVESRSRLVLDAAGAVVEVTGVLRDLTEAFEAERTRRTLQERLNQSGRMASLGMLAAGVAHEVNNPLTVLKANLDILAQRGDWPAGSPVARCLDRMDHSARRIMEIVGHLKAYARADGRGLDTCDAAEVARGVHDLVQSIYAHEGVEVRLELRLAPAPARGGAGPLQQVLMNLLSNARDAMQAVKGPRVIDITVDAGAGGPEIRVADRGPGIPESALPMLFEPFFTTKPAGKGTGLGLSISRSLVRDMGGELSAASAPGGGAVFTVGLAAADAAPARQPAAAGRKVLVVDDEAGVRESLRLLLESKGWSVTVADTAGEALRILRDGAFEAVITDVIMPGRSGDELLEEARGLGLPHLASTRWVAVSGNGLEDFPAMVRRRLKASADALLRKPFDADELERHLAKGAAKLPLA